MMGILELMMIIFMMFIYLNFMKYKLKFYFISNFLFFLTFILLFNYTINFNWFMISNNLSFNNYNFMLIILTKWIFAIIFMIMNKMKYLYLCLNILMMLMLNILMNFFSMEILMFYFFFEMSLVLTFFLITIWGLGYMRLLAGYYLIFYTLFFSLPLLIFLMMMIYENNLSLIMLMEMYKFNLNKFMFMYLIFSFLIKVPIFSLHNWLLKAHVEAPVFGSMILASILLKLGTYGLLRFILMMISFFLEYNWLLMIYSLIGSILISFICLRQIDMKMLIAYSSIVHMGLLILGLMTMFKVGFLGSYIMMIAHGLCSSGLFYLVNIIYEQSSSRLMFINKGMMSLMPSMSLMWFLLCSSNMAVPLSMNLSSEILLMMSSIMWFEYLYILLFILCFFSFTYSLFLFSYIQHGNMNFYILNMNNGKMINFIILMLHWFPLNFLTFNMFFI